MIKAIETQYKGYRFRSRLEARWAVFFDALGIAWEYEQQGLMGPDGQRWLPDFELIVPDEEFKDERLLVEIKPRNTQFDIVDRLHKFAMHNRIWVLLILGTPGQDTSKMLVITPGGLFHIVFFAFNLSGTIYLISARLVGKEPLQYEFDEDCPTVTLVDRGQADAGDWMVIPPIDRDITDLAGTMPFAKGVVAARSARFEHGEKPRL